MGKEVLMVRRLRSAHSLACAIGIAAAVLAVAVLSTGDFAGAAAPGNGAGYKRAPSYTLTTGPTREELASRRQALHGALAREIPAGVLSDPIVVNLTAEETRELKDRGLASANHGPVVVGRTKPVNSVVRFSDLDSRLISKLPRRVGTGVAQATPDGGFVWAVALRSEGAAGMRAHIKGLNLPNDADLYWLNMSGAAYGPYQRRGPHRDGDFWTHTISGSEGVLMVRHFGPNGAAEMRRSGFAIADLGHVGPKYGGVLGSSPEEFCRDNEPCIVNANCQSTGPASQNAIAMMQWIAGAWINVCTGGLLNDSASSGTRHFLTAKHCVSKAKDAKNLETYFQYHIPCGQACPEWDNPGGTQVNGATVQSHGNSGDYSLLLLNSTDPLPGGTVFLGWDSAPIAFSDGQALHRISHPNWAPQAYSAHVVDTSWGTCSGWPRGAWIYSSDTFAGTEGGSSGSPVVNSSGDVVGQLSGGCGTNINDPCDSGSNATVDGAFAHYFSSIESILDPGGCTVTEDPEVSCSDGIDNDCDGATDSADSDCGGDPCVNPGGDPPGASCDSGATCCSNKCKGKPGSRTCR
jgi:hypothetical protein